MGRMPGIGPWEHNISIALIVSVAVDETNLYYSKQSTNKSCYFLCALHIIIDKIYIFLFHILIHGFMAYIGCCSDGRGGSPRPRVRGRGRVSIVTSAGVNTRVTGAPLLQSVPDISDTGKCKLYFLQSSHYLRYSLPCGPSMNMVSGSYLG